MSRFRQTSDHVAVGTLEYGSCAHRVTCTASGGAGGAIPNHWIRVRWKRPLMSSSVIASTVVAVLQETKARRTGCPVKPCRFIIGGRYISRDREPSLPIEMPLSYEVKPRNESGLSSSPPAGGSV